MKLPQSFTIYDCRSTIGRKSAASAVGDARGKAAANRQSPIANRKSDGIALVITLIMLSVTLVMAVAFLALSRRERASVSTVTDTTTARLAADTALAAAQAQVMAGILSTGNGLYNFGLLVSTNYQNGSGYFIGIQNPTNVNFDFRNVDGQPLNSADMVQNIANLQFLPRVPVFITTNNLGSNDFRYYLDINRNGQFDQTGNSVPNVDNTGATNGTVSEIGDPQWIGVLERPDTTHSPNNKFVARYAFFAVPIGNALDINAIHNQTLAGPANPNALTNAVKTGFFRNQGVGSWEINLAAFLADLNTNQWDSGLNDYGYNEPGSLNTGYAFLDALSILSYRYDYSYSTLLPAGSLFQNANLVFPNDNVDEYSDGPLQTTTTNINEAFSLPSDGDINPNTVPWAGADNTNQFFDLTSDLFDPTKTSTAFTNRLLTSGNSIATYDRYTLSRLLSELGTDSQPDDNKMDLNYTNLDANGNVVPNLQTNLGAWTPLQFFTNAADRMLRSYSASWFANSPTNYLQTYYGIIGTNAYYYHNDVNGNVVFNDPTGFGLTNLGMNTTLPGLFLNQTNQVPSFGIANIPVYVNGQFVYSPAINRVLQLAANIYDASTNAPYPDPAFFPSVFRPIFEHDNSGNVFITGFTGLSYDNVPNTVSGENDPQLNPPYDVVNLPTTANYTPIVDNNNYLVNIYDVPWIIGAKKGFPNFNNFAEENIVGVTRRLQVTRDTNSTSYPLTGTNQMYMFNIQTSLGLDFWNSYKSNYVGNLAVIARGYVGIGLTNNDSGFNANESSILTNMWFSYGFDEPFPAYGTVQSYANWPAPQSFLNWSTNAVMILTNSVYRSAYALPANYYAPGGVPSLVPTNDFQANSFSPPLLYETNGVGFHNPAFQLPKFGLLTTNQLQAFSIDFTDNVSHVVDYVQLKQQQGIDLNSQIFTDDANGVWNTNTAANGLPNGINNQLAISEGMWQIPTEDPTWPDSTRPAQEAKFQIFNLKGYGSQKATLQYPTVTTMTASNFSDNAQTPYSPTRYVASYVNWEANDPLVHYMASDLTYVKSNTAAFNTASFPSLTNFDLGYLNKSYRPWGGNARYTNTDDTTQFSFWLKDPLMFSSDNWDFPTSKYPSVGWLGRVHRGTPWQTVYLKATDVLQFTNAGNQNVGIGLWSGWTGDQNLYDAKNSAPVWDRDLFDLFTTALNDNAVRGTLSVNVDAGNPDPLAGLAAWSAVLSGVVTLTNTATAPSSVVGTSNNWLVIAPAGTAGAQSALGEIVTNINFIRTHFTNPDGMVGAFEHVGDILSVPALTVGLTNRLLASSISASPFINTNVVQQQPQFGVSDEVYERIPQQVMGLLRISTAPRYVVYCYGQALRPAVNGLVTAGGANFGLVTNYQVVAESAARAIISVQTNVVATPTGFTTNYTTKVESYNVLPPN
jgi:hypothetical protein